MVLALSASLFGSVLGSSCKVASDRSHAKQVEKHVSGDIFFCRNTPSVSSLFSQFFQADWQVHGKGTLVYTYGDKFIGDWVDAGFSVVCRFIGFGMFEIHIV